MDKYDNTLTIQDYRDLANAQAGSLDRYNEDDMARVQPLFKKGYIAIADARFVILTEAGYNCMAAVKFERYNQKEWFEKFPEIVAELES